MGFKTGDAIVHPIRGAGVIKRIEKRRWHGNNESYYRIELLSQPGTKLMLPTKMAEEIGLRRAVSQRKLKKVWQVLEEDPNKLPSDHKKRYAILEEKLHAGDIFELAEAVRDMTWRQEEERKLTTKGKRIYDEGMLLLAGEIAAAQGIELPDAEGLVRKKLKENVLSSVS